MWGTEEAAPQGGLGTRRLLSLEVVGDAVLCITGCGSTHEGLACRRGWGLDALRCVPISSERLGGRSGLGRDRCCCGWLVCQEGLSLGRVGVMDAQVPQSTAAPTQRGWLCFGPSGAAFRRFLDSLLDRCGSFDRGKR